MGTLVKDNNITASVANAIRTISPEDPFAGLRAEALAHFEKLELPGKKAEEYKHTPLTLLLEKNFSFATANPPVTDINIAPFSLSGIEANALVFINGQFMPSLSRIISASSGITILPLNEAIEKDHNLVSSHLGQIADHTTDAYAALNTASWTNGVFIHVAAGRQVEHPIVIHHIHDVRAGQVISAVRNLVIVERNAEVTILEKFDSAGTMNGFSSVVSEALVGGNAGLTWYSIQNDAGNRYHFDHKQIRQEDSSRVNTFTFTLDGKIVRNNLHLALDGEGIDSHMYGLYLIGKDTIADNHTVADHRQPHSFSNELYKGIIEDSAKGVFNGKIYVRPNAQKTNAFQANRNILLTDKASVNTKPQLEIWADDVKCSHGCTSGQLDEEALFYLRTRGINKDTARAMMLYAFAAELLENMKHKGIRQYIDSLISERLHKNF
jgi:Fe-S cluster assembly protein SufD